MFEILITGISVVPLLVLARGRAPEATISHHIIKWSHIRSIQNHRTVSLQKAESLLGLKPLGNKSAGFWAPGMFSLVRRADVC